MKKLKNRIAIITGGSRGMGRAYCERFCEEGATVALVFFNQADAASEVVTDISKKGGKIKAFQCDVTQLDKINDMVLAVVQEFGGVDILINNAGVYLLTPVDSATENDWDKQIDTTLKAPFFCSQAVVPHMKKRGGGKIINIGSIFGEGGFSSSSAYCASKGGIKQLTRTMCLELRSFNIQVNTLSPGCVKTDLNEQYRSESPEFLTSLQGRFGEGDPWLDAKETTGAAVFLACSDSDAVTGANIMVDRGYSAY